MKQKNTVKLRGVLILSTILCFIFFIGVFVYQYVQYKRIEDRLNAAYSTTYLQSSNTYYELFSTFSEAENLFRLYTVDFNKESFEAYKNKLGTIKYMVDSIAALPIDDNPFAEGNNEIETYQSFALEFALIKQAIDKLVLFASDSLQSLVENSNLTSRQQQKSQNADSLISQIMRDTLDKDLLQDTLIKQKQGLFQRIFNAKNDTLVSNSTYEVLNTKQVDIVHRNVERLISTNEKIYSKNMRNLQAKFLQMQNKERELVKSNYTLLNNLKIGLDKIKQLELGKLRQVEERDFSIYRANFNRFGNQLIAALVIMLLMVIFI